MTTFFLETSPKFTPNWYNRGTLQVATVVGHPEVQVCQLPSMGQDVDFQPGLKRLRMLQA